MVKREGCHASWQDWETSSLDLCRVLGGRFLRAQWTVVMTRELISRGTWRPLWLHAVTRGSHFSKWQIPRVAVPVASPPQPCRESIPGCPHARRAAWLRCPAGAPRRSRASPGAPPAGTAGRPRCAHGRGAAPGRVGRPPPRTRPPRGGSGSQSAGSAS